MRRRERVARDKLRMGSRPARLRGRSPKRSLHLRAPHSEAVRSEFLGGGLNIRNPPTPGVGRDVLNSSTMAACRICSLFWAFQNHLSPRYRYRTQGVIMRFHARATVGRARITAPLTRHDCSADPPSSAASAAEASLPDPRSMRASFLSGVSPQPGSRPPAPLSSVLYIVEARLPRLTWAPPFRAHMPRTSSR